MYPVHWKSVAHWHCYLLYRYIQSPFFSIVSILLPIIIIKANLIVAKEKYICSNPIDFEMIDLMEIVFVFKLDIWGFVLFLIFTLIILLRWFKKVRNETGRFAGMGSWLPNYSDLPGLMNCHPVRLALGETKVSWVNIKGKRQGGRWKCWANLRR